MNPSDAARTVTEEHDPLGRLHALLWANRDLERQVAELTADRDRTEHEVQALRDDRHKVRGLLSDAEQVIRSYPVSTPEDEMTVDDLWAILISIRSIVG